MSLDQDGTGIDSDFRARWACESVLCNEQFEAARALVAHGSRFTVVEHPERRRPVNPVNVTLASTLLAGESDAPLLLLGPSLGSTAEQLWRPAAEFLGERFKVVAWDLPGHGASPTEKRAFTVSDLARAVAGLVPRWGAEHTFSAGVSLGGAVALTMQLESPGLARAAAIICSGAEIGTPEAWRDRAAQIRSLGTASLVPTAAGRWFALSTLTGSAETVAAFTRTLAEVDDASYARCCEALAGYTVVDRLSEIETPILALWASHDQVTPEASALQIASGVHHGSVREVTDASHLAPVEQPGAVAGILTEFFDSATD